MKPKFTLFKLFSLLPVIGITLLLVHTQYQASTGLVYRVKIKGYDPRDLLHGHYLRYTFDLPDKASYRKHIYFPAAKYCFIHSETTDFNLKIISDNADTTKCSSVINYSKIKGSHKYFIPEDYALELERKLRNNKVAATVDLIINNTKNFTVGQLYFDDQSWEKVLIKK